jgi:hypothetical protein
VHIDLPGYRETPEHSTYAASKIEDLPPIPIELDDACAWLMSNGTIHEKDGLHRYEFDLQPAIIVEIAREKGLDLPLSFIRFMSSPELQSRVRSCTACYLDPGERIVPTIGGIEGSLVHFLSDSQSCAHWYVHILPNGEHSVLESEDLYCYKPENSTWKENPSCQLERIDLRGLGFAYCAPSFQEFLYRFWIENEIWYALLDDESRRPLNTLEQTYVSHYGSKMTSR